MFNVHPLDNNCYFYHNECDKIEQILEMEKKSIRPNGFSSLEFVAEDCVAKRPAKKIVFAAKLLVKTIAKNAYIDRDFVNAREDTQMREEEEENRTEVVSSLSR